MWKSRVLVLRLCEFVFARALARGNPEFCNLQLYDYLVWGVEKLVIKNINVIITK